MRRTVVAVDTVHASLFRRGDLLRAERPLAIEVFSHITIPILHANPGNNLALFVGSDERDFICKIHVPVDAGHWTTRGIAATDINQHPGLAQRVLLIVRIVIERLELSAIKLRRPVTLFARLVRRPHVVNRRFDRS